MQMLPQRWHAPVQVHELDGHLLEGALREQVPLDARQRLVRVVVRLRSAGPMLASSRADSKATMQMLRLCTLTMLPCNIAASDDQHTQEDRMDRTAYNPCIDCQGHASKCFLPLKSCRQQLAAWALHTS